MVFEEYIELAAADPWGIADLILNEPWYQMLPEDDQAEFWTKILIAVGNNYHHTKIIGLSKILDGKLPRPVHDMVYANLQQANNSNLQVW